MRTNNKIGHVKSGPCDKVYIVAIVDNGDGTYDAVGRYGRNGGNIKESKLATRVSRMAAERAANEQIRKKFNKNRDPYIDIDGSEYSGTLTRHSNWLKRWIEPETNTVTPQKVVNIPQANDPNEPATRPGSKFAGKDSVRKKREAKEAKTMAGQDDELVCIDNAGYERQFDIGVEYIVTYTKDADFYEVIDKYGEKQTMFRERFTTEAVAKSCGLLNEVFA